MMSDEKPATVLVVDDNEAKRYNATRTLRRGGYEVIEAVNGQDALDKAAERLPDIMVVDIKLPDINGFEVCRIIKSNAGTAFIPVLHYSATLNTSEARIYGLEEGADAFLTAEARPEELLATVKALLRMRRAETALRKRNERLVIISKTAEHLLGSADPNTMVSDLFALVSNHLDLDVYFNFMVNDAGDALRLDTCAGVTPEQMPPNTRLEFGDAICGRVGQHKKAIYASYIQQSDEPMVQLVKGFGIRAYACNPLMAGDRLMGTLSFATRQRDTFSADELEFLRIMCHYVALAKEKLEILEAARAANRRKDEFIANMSHEMRTPMNVVLGLGYILANSTPLTEKQKTCITTLQTSAGSLLELINDLLDIAKIESNSVELEHVPFSLFDLADEVNRMMQVRAEEKGIGLIFHYDLGAPRNFAGDPFRLRQILVNLLSNAIKFTESGKVELAIGRSDGRQDGVEISVADTGIGIADQKLGSIFNKFSQANSSTSRLYGGTGLGLTITKAFVELMNGQIHVESRVGSGTVFTITLPLPALADDGTHAPRETNTNLAYLEQRIPANDAPLILLAEDHYANQLVASELLNNLGYRYEIANTGKEAVDKVKEKPFDAILMDVQMPEMDGLEATRLIRQFHKLTDLVTPIIGITAYASSNDKDRCLDAGMDDYISKPFNPDELLNKLTQILNRKKSA